MPKITIEAPAKLNLHLRIGDRRPDGFHGIESLFLALAFGDALCLETVSPRQSLEIRMDWQVMGQEPLAIPPEHNIMHKAVSLFRRHAGYDEGLKIAITKRIPPGGGLGGGSSDAAAVLLALNSLASSGNSGLLSESTLFEMGASLGSDVPFFLHRSPVAWVSGRGEQVQPVALPEQACSLCFVLVNPGFPSDTAGAYKLFDDSYAAHRLRRSRRRRNGENILNILSSPPRGWPFTNDFMAVFEAAGTVSAPGESMFAAYMEICSSLRELGADYSGLSGSGSTCFGVFAEQEKAQSACEKLMKQWPFIIKTFPLAFWTIPYYNW